MKQRSLRRTQRGFTLVEIAVVLVIIGLLLGGVLKGQELINSAKVKSLVQEFNSVSTMVYGYQDRFRFLPGDDPQVAAHVGGTPATTPANSTGNSRIDGAWNSSTSTDESFLFWQHVRLAGLASGSTVVADANYRELNVENGPIGVSSQNPTSNGAAFPGQFYICSGGLSTRFARQIDTTMDDGVTNTGAVRTLQADGTFINLTAANEGDGNFYTVCAAY
ncbi:type II secretion system protein [Denitromonas iodatirespirans]|uniref:Prepilin-type N-terminal cleavage/methylation domain-containing protein n=1 Tax=Denitromonas iodatirespirans TaxID=2795389 RepID=A0A944DCQ9_DENI1|nr:prepilin-type N-terminal cleavage/methylation domain-containing protein [Denitromonas iodatirespirans]MBT0962686.1 prepilin-type N-terminal cleavage/methylation domain-containing protein [Denitromonas iodatirespirans]